MLDVDTSALADDPIEDLARQMYADSPFNTGCPWDKIPQDGRDAWYRRAANRWLGDAPSTAGL